MQHAEIQSKFKKYFEPEELVSPDLHGVLHDDFIYRMFDESLVRDLILLREKFGTMIINTWHSNILRDMYKTRQYSGLRSKECDVGAKNSYHKKGMAFDFLPVKVKDPAIVRQYIIDNSEKWWGITFIESYKGMGWVHIDCRKRNSENIAVWHPNGKKLDLDIIGRDVDY